VEAVKQSGAQAVHPGYGFLSENSKFVHALDEIGVAFIGPSEASMAVMGDKILSKRTAKEAGVSTIPGFDGPAESLEHAIEIGTFICCDSVLRGS
jgi:propionyl-CoA carboxylase alpha chain